MAARINDPFIWGIPDRPTFVAGTKAASMTVDHAQPTSSLIKSLRMWLLAAALGLGLVVVAQPTDLIISEYVEGSANNKYLELYNGTAAAINLADYQLRLYCERIGHYPPTQAPSPAPWPLAPPSFTRTARATHLWWCRPPNANVCNFNGDDAVALWKVSTASYVDIIGNIGCDPGTAWTATGISTLDRSIVRNSNVCAGVTIDPATACPFPTLVSEWTNNAIDVVANLGSHTMTCGPTVNFAAPTSSALESAGTVTVTLNISPAATAAETITIGVANGAGAVYGIGNDYTTAPVTTAGAITRTVPIGATSVTFSINITDDIVTEGDETITFTITGASAGLSLGSALTHTFTITDNDVTPTVNFSTLGITVLENTTGSLDLQPDH